MNMNTEQNNNQVKYSYHRDPKNHNRVMTIARYRTIMENKTVYWYAFAINDVKTDFFKKSLGREIATTRLEKYVDLKNQSITCGDNRGVIVVTDNGRKHNPVQVILGDLVTNKNSIVRRIANEEFSPDKMIDKKIETSSL